jgi:hypothetical protein
MKQIIILGLVFFVAFWLGVIAAPKNPTITNTKEVVKVDQNRENLWLQLKDTDDQAFRIAGDGFDYCSSMVTTTDQSYMNELISKMKANNSKVSLVLATRLDLLDKLGLRKGGQ